MKNRLRQIRMLLLDVDGVLTDGRISKDSRGTEILCFNTHDGAGVVYAMRCGVDVAILSGRKSPCIRWRAKDLGIRELHLGFIDKISEYEKILASHGIVDANVCYVGDDLADIGLVRRVGVGVAVANARPEVKECAAYVTKCDGGKGAVREVVELILKAQGKWAGIVESRGMKGVL
jgi:3-deoxy-D-manno-octulosonate 8-phosphate phosphatase (KDO 8-P phosphatase)